MKPILENIVFFLKRRRCIFFVWLLVFGHASAQSSVPDSLVPPPATEDTASAVEGPDSNLERVTYFDRRADHSKTDSIHLREVPAQVIDSLKRDEAFWYADKIFKKEKKPNNESRDNKLPSQWMNMPMLVAIVVIFIGLLLVYLLQNNIIRRRQRVVADDKEDHGSEEDIFDINYQREIEKAISSANYRWAIRLMFLRLLKTLSEKNIINYKQERTNSDYLMQLGASAYYSDFFRLTRNFEYAWYGKFEVTRDVFTVIQNDFEKFDRKLP